jgi:hypothetical protein
VTRLLAVLKRSAGFHECDESTRLRKLARVGDLDVAVPCVRGLLRCTLLLHPTAAPDSPPSSYYPTTL